METPGVEPGIRPYLSYRVPLFQNETSSTKKFDLHENEPVGGGTRELGNGPVNSDSINQFKQSIQTINSNNQFKQS